ncbi:MAG: methionine biosynthesis protein MetW [Thermoleophilia bacterium]|nr:methionine biosynthesis protein MetW [Thermoleophilia bacterium]
MRADLDIVAGMIGEGKTALDLGCGDGALLEALIERQDCRGFGVERDLDRFLSCIDRGVPVTRGDLEEELALAETSSLDVAVLSLTLQATRHPERVLEEMSRVAARQIVSLPNFAHWKLRATIALRGRMPVSPILPYEWYDTPNIHLCTLADFEGLVAQVGLRIEDRVLLDSNGHKAPAFTTRARNLLAEGAVYSLTTG